MIIKDIPESLLVKMDSKLNEEIKALYEANKASEIKMILMTDMNTEDVLDIVNSEGYLKCLSIIVKVDSYEEFRVLGHYTDRKVKVKLGLPDENPNWFYTEILTEM